MVFAFLQSPSATRRPANPLRFPSWQASFFFGNSHLFTWHNDDHTHSELSQPGQPVSIEQVTKVICLTSNPEAATQIPFRKKRLHANLLLGLADSVPFDCG